MKLFALALVLVSFNSFAHGNGEFDEMDIDYVSWCQKNQVMTQENNGDVTVLFDCTEREQKCRQYEMRRAHRMIVSAACVEN